MKRLFLTVVLLFLVCLCGCAAKDDAGVPSYFLEPEGYVIATVNYGELGLFGYSVAYGYISEVDYQEYLDGQLSENLTVLHPWEEGKSVIVNAKSIVLIEMGAYRERP